jgi:DNA-binding beta-propeller fold protein YncE
MHRCLIRTLQLAAVLAIASTSALAGEGYRLDTSFKLALPEGLTLGQVAGLAFSSQEHLIVSHRGPRPILVYDKDGKLLHMFGDNELTAVHGTRIDAHDNLWVTDHKNHTVIQYGLSGKVLRILGRRDMPGEGEATFNRPTDVAFAPNGDVFISDGYGNNRVVKFNADGKFVKAWGKKGGWVGQFTLPHCVAFDAKGLLHVADRENDRIQVFDQNGSFVRLYGGFAPFGIFITPEQELFVADGRAHQCYRMTLEGKVLDRWGSEGSGPGQFKLPHAIAVDRQGRVYVAEIEGRRVQRFVKQ